MSTRRTHLVEVVDAPSIAPIVVAIPVAAGALYPVLGLLLRLEFGALAMSSSSITVVSNA